MARLDDFIKTRQKSYDAYSHIILRCYVSTAVFGAASAVNIIALAGGKLTALRVIATVLTGLAFVLFGVSLVMYLKGRRAFRKECSALSDSALESFERAVTLGNRWFSEEYLLFYGNARVHVVKYPDIASAEQKVMSIRLCYNGVTAHSALAVSENAAIVLAALKSKNDNITFIINGRTVDTSKGANKEANKGKDTDK